MITGDGDCEIEPCLAELVLCEARVSSRVILVHGLDLQRITLQIISARRIYSTVERRYLSCEP